jgi:tetratricopeptide (TPR) repeat protein
MLVLGGMIAAGLSSCGAGRHASASAPDQATASRGPAFYSAAGDTSVVPAYADSIFVEAEKQKILGNVPYAIRLFHQFLEASPASPTAYYELALLYGKLKKNQQTLDNAREASLRDTANRWYAIAYANALAMNKEYDSAALVFHRLADREPSRQEFLYNEAVMLSDGKSYRRALDLFTQLEDGVGINEEFVFQKQRIYLKMGKPDSAALEIQKLIDLSPENSRYYGLLAQVYSDNHQPDKAIRVYKSLLNKYPDNPQAMVALGLFYKQKGNDEAFRSYMAQAFGNPRFDINEKIAFVYPYLKYVEVDSTKKKEALTLCRLILNAHPEDPRAHALFGDMYFQCGIPDSALLQYQKTLALDDSRFEVWNQLMVLYAEQGNNDSLLSASRRAVVRFPREPGAWYFRGMALFFAGEDRGSIESLSQALELDIRDKDLKGRIFSTLGEAYNDLRDYQASDSCFQASLRLNPDDDQVLNNYSYHLAERQAHLSRALMLIKAAVALKPDQIMYEDTYAWVLFNMGEYKAAKVWMEKVLDKPEANQHAGYLEHYGDILFKNEEVSQAIRYWKLAKKAGGGSSLLDWKISKQKLPPVKRIMKQQNRKR